MDDRKRSYASTSERQQRAGERRAHAWQDRHRYRLFQVGAVSWVLAFAGVFFLVEATPVTAAIVASLGAAVVTLAYWFLARRG